MRISGNIICIALAAVLSFSCGNNQPSEDASLPVRKFPEIEIPGMYQNQDNSDLAKSYYIQHYWDKLADTTGQWRCDSMFVAGVAKDELEQAFSNYVWAASSLPIDEGCRYMSSFYRQMSNIRGYGNVYPRMMEIAERYLYDPNSPVRNEDLWQPLAAALAADPATSEDLRFSYEYQAKMCMLNRIGSKAADVRFCDKKGRVRNLYSIEAEFTILFFSNPGCHACKDIIENLKNMPKVDDMITDGFLAVVNVYIDEDITAWYDYMPYYPENWYNGYDPNYVIRTEQTYDVRAIPSLYLLDRNKVVIGKDIPEGVLFNFLDNI